jgi:hypothetical protein
LKSYTDLLEEVKSKIIDLQKPIIATAKEFIPKMYSALINENPRLTPLEARNIIIKDCKQALWSPRTILGALPDEAKNLEKQMAGRQRYKNKIQNPAAIIATPTSEVQKIILDANDRTTYSPDLEDLINENYELKQIIRKNTEIKTANNIINENRIFKIPKDKFSSTVVAIYESREYCNLKFDENKILIHVQSDIVEED